MFTQSRLKQLLHYDPATGVFTRLYSHGSVRVGDVAGSSTCGYLQIRVDGNKYLAHRLAFLYMDGYFPEYQVDHKDGCGLNNKWENLRHVTQSCNMQNLNKSRINTSGFTGVSRHKASNKWTASIMVNGKLVYLGCHDDKISSALHRCYFESCCPDWNCNLQAVNFIKLRELGYLV